MTERTTVVLLREEIEDLDRIRGLLRCHTRTEAVRNSVDICLMVITAIQDGGAIHIEDPSGKRHSVVIPGLRRQG